MKIANKPLLAGLLLALTLPFAAHADVPGRHPAYLHALSDLRAARWMLAHRPGEAAVSGHEDVAITQIDAAIREIKHAAIDDGKNIEDHPTVDVPNNRPGRLRKALELLRKVHADVAREEDDPITRGLRDRAVGHIDAAIHATDGALVDAEHGG
ncbi:MAG: hypothetical protein WA825_06820 [Steroidobacteraceae bacterium]